jgi:predicted NBD/HSP70 family sugar kinase
MVRKWDSALGGTSSLRKGHRSLALRSIFCAPGISRVDLASRLGLSSMAIGRIVRELEQAGLVGEVASPAPVASRGRPATRLELNRHGAFVVGAVISAFSQEIAVLNIRAESVASTVAAIADSRDGPGSIKTVCHQVDALLKQAEIPKHQVAAMGFAVAANVNSEQGVVIGGGYLGWTPFDLRALVALELGLPTVVNNVADALIRAETFFGCARDARTVVLIHSATTLGASFAIDGELLRGAHFQPGRIGHFPARQTQLVCSCGQTNCLNCSASGWSVLRRLGIATTPQYRPEHVNTYAQAIHALVNGELGRRVGLARTRRLLREAGVELAKSLRYLELTFDPDMLIVAGSVAVNDAYYDGVIHGLQTSGPAGLDVAEKLLRGTISPVRGAGLSALLDSVFSPDFDLKEIDPAVASVNKVNEA